MVPFAIKGLVGGLSFKDVILFRRKVEIVFGEPIFPQTLFAAVPSDSKYKDGAKVVMKKIEILLSEVGK